MPLKVHPLFVYGTLRDPDILLALLGRALNADAMLLAHAPGFVAVNYPGRVYPALVRYPGGAAEGLMLTDLTPFERDLLDAFEGNEYRRDFVAVVIGEELHEAEAYLPTAMVKPGAPTWELSRWQAEHKERTLSSERQSASDLRLKLLAIRPI
ncbi:MAG: gamma-glutamylcyclotransferase family protein [Devosia sp.]